MLEAIIVALITGTFALAGTVISNFVNHSKTMYRIEQLEKKQDKHNSLIERMYCAENAINLLDERQKSILNDISDIKKSVANDGK